MQTLSGTGIILHRKRHLDHDVQVTLFMRETGKVLGVIKGAQKMSSKLKVLQEAFSEIEVQIYSHEGSSHARIIGGKLLNSHMPLRQNTGRFFVASQCCELVQAAIPFRAPSPDTFDVLQETLENLEKAPNAQAEWVFFVLRLMRVLGHGDLAAALLRHSGVAAQKWPSPEVELRRILSLNASFLNRANAFVNTQIRQLLEKPLKSCELDELKT